MQETSNQKQIKNTLSQGYQGISQVVIYTDTPREEPNPSTPIATSYDVTTHQFHGLTTGWYLTPPSEYDPQRKYFYSHVSVNPALAKGGIVHNLKFLPACYLNPIDGRDGPAGRDGSRGPQGLTGADGTNGEGLNLKNSAIIGSIIGACILVGLLLT